MGCAQGLGSQPGKIPDITHPPLAVVRQCLHAENFVVANSLLLLWSYSPSTLLRLSFDYPITILYHPYMGATIRLPDCPVCGRYVCYTECERNNWISVVP